VLASRDHWDLRPRKSHVEELGIVRACLTVFLGVIENVMPMTQRHKLILKPGIHPVSWVMSEKHSNKEVIAQKS
jgi:hypothetical protein